MIKKIEISEAANMWGITLPVVEKDYILGWVLMGLSTHPEIKNEWVFKGGTSIKKCYIETYRFSEDLDFTLIDGAKADLATISRAVEEIADWITSECGIKFSKENLSFEAKPNKRGTFTIRGKLGYIGPLDQPSHTNIKFDITTDEIILRPPILREIHHPYTDRPTDNEFQIRAYPIEEILAEKTRAMIERCRPRDIYDIVRLFRSCSNSLNPTTINQLILGKCEIRGLNPNELEDLIKSNKILELRTDWDAMLHHQLPELPGVEIYIDEFQHYLDWLDGIEPEQKSPLPYTGVEKPWPPSNYLSLPSDWGSSSPMEVIRFAGANRLKVLLDYREQNGSIGIRTVEPYSIRLTKDGNILFYGRNIDRPRISAYRADRILGVKVTKDPFSPIWRVEF